MNFDELAKLISKSNNPEDLFTIANLDDLHREYQLIVHPDRNNSSAESTEVFALLEQLYHSAKEKIANNTFGTLGTIKNGKTEYILNKVFAKNSLSTLFLTDKNTVQIYNRSNKLAVNSVTLRKAIDIEYEINNLYKISLENHLIKQIDNFVLQTGQNVIVHESLNGFYSLEQVKQQYSKGVELKHAAWMFNRILGSLSALHIAQIVNAQITPDNFFIEPETHNGKLLDFSYGLKLGQVATAISGKYKDFYPAEVFLKQPSNYSLDIYMAACCLEYLLGEQSVPPNITNFIRYCKLGRAQRPNNVCELHDEFHQILRTIFGEAKFHRFSMKG